jgi:hypothetical protein
MATWARYVEYRFGFCEEMWLLADAIITGVSRGCSVVSLGDHTPHFRINLIWQVV